MLNIIVGFVAFQHLSFLVLEMFLWKSPIGKKIFGLSDQYAETTASLAANQGLYNGFLAMGLIWALLHPTPSFALQLKIFFLTCIVIAGIYGAISVNIRILFIQSIPALIGLIYLFLQNRNFYAT